MDDVQYLLKSAKEESYLLVVDSRARDTSVYPTPSEYDISFSSPFRNVFGLDLLDATVARTEYIVDTTTNALEYVVAQPASFSDWNQGAWVAAQRLAGRKRRVELDPGDYTLPQLVEHMNLKLAAAAGENEPPLTVAPDTNPSELNNKILFACSQPFTLLMGSSSLRHTLGFGDPIATAVTADYASVPGWSVNLTGGASDTFLSVPSAVLPNSEALVATTGPLPGGHALQYATMGTVRQYFTSQTTGTLSRVLAYVYGVSDDPVVSLQVVRVSDDVVVGTASSAVPVQDLNDVYVPVEFVVSGGGVLQAGAAYYVDMQVAVGAAGIYYNEDNLPVSGTRYMTVDDETMPGMQACCDVVLSASGHIVRSPGLVNLTGPRYVNIRCPEIESHMFRDRINEKVHAGLGMVQLRSYGFRQQRFDFVSFPARRFHPLGKLSKMTFRLERPDGTLYDSHGVDHTLLLVLRYYSLPSASPSTHASSLNPHYVPDIRHHMIETKWADEARATDYTYKRF